MGNEMEFAEFMKIKEEMSLVYQHDNRPWMIGFSGGKDSTLLVSLVCEMLMGLPKEKRNKRVYIVSSDTLVENPIVRDYMHKMSRLINDNCSELNIKAEIIYPQIKDSFWTKVIGLGYLTPEAPGFRWCTERLKIHPMNDYTLNKIKSNGEVVLLLGVRKAESTYRANNIRSREIEGKLLIPHNDIQNAFVYNPLTEIPNEEVWKYLLRDEAISPWKSDNKFLFSLYQGENLKEEESVIGEVDKDKISVTGNSRFGCWICTMVKEDKSLKAFIDRGETWLIPLRDFRNWLLELRVTPEARETKRRNGAMYRKPDGTLGLGPFTLKTRQDILKRLLLLENELKISLISVDELKFIDSLWDQEGDLSRRNLVDIYHEVKGKQLPWDQYKQPMYEDDIINLIKEACVERNVEFELISKLLVEIDSLKSFNRSDLITKAFNKIINQGWLHFESIEKGLSDEN